MNFFYLIADGLIMKICAAKGQSVDTGNIYTFSYASKTYEIVRENKTWSYVSVCAVESDGMLVEMKMGNFI